AALGILTALLEREKSGKGQQIETSLLQAQIFMLDFQAARWLMAKEIPEQAGNNHPTSAPTGVYKTSDGYINIATTGTKMWQRMCEALGAPELTKRPEYASAAERLKHRDALNADIDAHTVKRTSKEWVDRLNEAGVPTGPIYAINEVFSDPQVQHLKIAQTVKAKDRSMTIVGQPVTLSRTPSRLASPPPTLGQHTNVVLKEFGFSTKQINELRAAKAI
ncbi:MAG: CaiB/BaiF CoA-transferase family protein, partial [Xanthobacteraceae bacterium]